MTTSDFRIRMRKIYSTLAGSTSFTSLANNAEPTIISLLTNEHKDEII